MTAIYQPKPKPLH